MHSTQKKDNNNSNITTNAAAGEREREREKMNWHTYYTCIFSLNTFQM